MKASLRSLLALCLLPAVVHAASADTIGDVVKAQVILGKVLQFTQQYQAVNAKVTVPAPLPDNSGKYYLPFKDDGTLTDWAQKAMGAAIGSAVGSKVGEKVGQQAASQIPVPFAGALVGGFAKKKGKELGALAALGGAEFVKGSSTKSFNSLEDYAIYLHQTHSGGVDYVKGLAAAMALYPDLMKKYEDSVRGAYKRAGSR